MGKQVYNPYLPSYEYIPDGEPHVFGDRVYVYGSHDRFDGAEFCLNDYVCYSAPVTDLTDWKYEGVIFRKDQDPRNQNIPEDAPAPQPKFGVIPSGPDALNPPGIHALWAPDVVKGLDGRYYLYYCLDYLPEIGVAVCDTPAGAYEYLGLVCHKDGTPLGRRRGDLIQFDPGIFIDEDETIYLYSGNDTMRPECPQPEKGSQVMKLEKDMLTLKEEPKRLLPGLHSDDINEYVGHEFFEASSIRKIGEKYYLVYSSVKSQELCYAVSDRPDEGYRFGGTLVDIGDAGLDGREIKDSLNPYGNTHGGIESINGNWYVFYHRQTNRTNFSRQGCAEKICFAEDGSIAQVEVTSCGLNQGPLLAEGTCPAYICCQLTGEKGACFSNPTAAGMEYPYLTQDTRDIEPDSEAAKREAELPHQYIANIQNGTTIGYKYFQFSEAVSKIVLKLRGKGNGKIIVSVDKERKCIGCTETEVDTQQWTEVECSLSEVVGVHALYIQYEGEGVLDFVEFSFV